MAERSNYIRWIRKCERIALESEWCIEADDAFWRPLFAQGLTPRQAVDKLFKLINKATMNTTKPSAGALKAAEAICQWNSDSPPPAYIIEGRQRWAEHIDKESGLAELLEAAKDAQCDCSPKERDSGHKSECWFPALREAIAKASNPNADVQQVAPQGRWTEKGTV